MNGPLGPMMFWGVPSDDLPEEWKNAELRPGEHASPRTAALRGVWDDPLDLPLWEVQ